MDFKTFFYKKVLIGFFVATTCIGAAMATLGLLYEPDVRFGYQGLFSPLIYGVLTMLPSLVTYSKNEVSVRGALVRKLLELVMIELIVLLIVYFGGSLTSLSLGVSIALSVFLIYMTVNLVLWASDRKTAKVFNEALLELQQNNEQGD